MQSILCFLCLLKGHRWKRQFSSRSFSKQKTVTYKRITCRRCHRTEVRTHTIVHPR
jgi:hypothetical protein